MKIRLVLSIFFVVILGSCSLDKELATPKSEVDGRIEAEVNGKRVVIDNCDAVVGSLYIQVVSLGNYPFHSFNFLFPPKIQVNKDYYFSEEGFYADYGNTVEDVIYESYSGKINFYKIINEKSFEANFEFEGKDRNGKNVYIKNGKLLAIIKDL